MLLLQKVILCHKQPLYGQMQLLSIRLIDDFFFFYHHFILTSGCTPLFIGVETYIFNAYVTLLNTHHVITAPGEKQMLMHFKKD